MWWWVIMWPNLSAMSTWWHRLSYFQFCFCYFDISKYLATHCCQYFMKTTAKPPKYLKLVNLLSPIEFHCSDLILTLFLFSYFLNFISWNFLFLVLVYFIFFLSPSNCVYTFLNYFLQFNISILGGTVGINIKFHCAMDLIQNTGIVLTQSMQEPLNRESTFTLFLFFPSHVLSSSLNYFVPLFHHHFYAPMITTTATCDAGLFRNSHNGKKMHHKT